MRIGGLAMNARVQFRIVATTNGKGGFVAFVDAADEAGARAFFAAAFPSATVVSVTPEPVDPCSAYERRP